MPARLDVYMAAQGLCESRELAQRLIMAGAVRVNGEVARKASQAVKEGAVVTLEQEPPYVSRGGYKLERGLDVFGLDPKGRICIDAGASTGGFTDCLLQRGAQKVYAVDVGYGQLHWKLRNDARVAVMEKTNARHLAPDMFLDAPDLGVMDVSFISIRLILPALRACLAQGWDIVTLIKPQFEIHQSRLRKGVVRKAEDHVAVLEDMLAYFAHDGLALRGLTYSPVTGPKGNIEFLAHLKSAGEACAPDVAAIVAEAHRATTHTGEAIGTI